MQIHNEIKSSALSNQPVSQDIKEGGTYRATVKEVLPNQEAIVQLKGVDVQVKYEGELPKSGNVFMQVSDMKQALPVVKVMKEVAPPVQTARTTSTALSEPMKQAVQLLQQRQIPITKEMLQHLKVYMDQTPGTDTQKLETISQMATKKLNFTPQQLKAVHEALHGERLGQVLQSLVRDINAEGVVPRTADLGGIDIEFVGQKGEQQRVTLPMVATIQEALHQVKTTGQFPQLISTLQATLETLPDTQKVDLQQAIQQAVALNEKGRELAARQHLVNVLGQMEQQVLQSNTAGTTQEPTPDRPNTLSQTPEAQEAAYRISGELLASIPIESRNIIVTTISERLSKAALDFANVKRDLSNTLQTADHMMRQAPIQAQTSLEAAIKQLDHAILKSDFMLYTDMGTEKKLLMASSQLQEARKWLAAGEFSKASEIIREVRTTVDQLIFKPSEVKVKHFVAKEMLQQEPLPRQLTQGLVEPLHTLRREPTPRHALEYVRSLGLTYETDVAHRLVAGDARTTVDESVKNMLQKLIQLEGNQSTGQKAEQALTNITGQQLLSKADHSGLQTMLFSLPILLKDQLENVQVFVKSANRNDKIDWENCSLYFLLETKRMGDVGILLTAVDRTLSITIKNDMDGFKTKMEPLAEKAQKRLEEIGYHINAIQFAPLTTPEAEKTATESESSITARPTLTERGYDFSV